MFADDTDGIGVVVERLDVPEVVDAVKWGVRHAELFALIDVRRASMQVQHCREHLRRLDAIGTVVTESGHGTRLVVVVPVKRVPADVGESRLPATERRLEITHVERMGVPLVRS